MSRFTEDLALAKPGEPPKSLGGLKTRLGLWDKPEGEARTLILRWLRTNEPTTDFMRAQMVYEGYLSEHDRHAA